MKKLTIKVPKEVPVTQPPEVRPQAQPGMPQIPEEESRISPYDFPPPGEGFFPEMF